MTIDKPGPTITETALAEMARTALRMASPPETIRLVVWRANHRKWKGAEAVKLWGKIGPTSSADSRLVVLYEDGKRVALMAVFRLADIVLWYRDKRPGMLDEHGCEASP